MSEPDDYYDCPQCAGAGWNFDGACPVCSGKGWPSDPEWRTYDKSKETPR